MSRIGRLPIIITPGVTVKFENEVVTVVGKLGTLTQHIDNKHISLRFEGDTIHVERNNEVKSTKAAHGLYRSLIANMIEGVSKGYEKSLIIAGVGYKVQLDGKNLVMNVGYSHMVKVEAPAGIAFSCPTLTEICVKGIDKTVVGQAAANIRCIRKPEPYHGYGIHYKNETIIRKEGKTTGK